MILYNFDNSQFGGGNSEIMDDLMVYSTENGNWFQPNCNGDVPLGVAAHGMIADGTRIIIHGGMQEFGKMSNTMVELQASKWEWRKLNQEPTPPSEKHPKGEIPCPRMCHRIGTNILIGIPFYHQSFISSHRFSQSESNRMNDTKL